MPAKTILDRIPAGRWGTPQDLQGAAVFLSSAASQYPQGYTIAVDGGWLARRCGGSSPLVPGRASGRRSPPGPAIAERWPIPKERTDS
jgi:hypothetical protein